MPWASSGVIALYIGIDLVHKERWVQVLYMLLSSTTSGCILNLEFLFEFIKAEINQDIVICKEFLL